MLAEASTHAGRRLSVLPGQGDFSDTALLPWEPAFRGPRPTQPLLPFTGLRGSWEGTAVTCGIAP